MKKMLPLLLLLVASPLVAQSVSDAEIQAAIARANKFKLLFLTEALNLNASGFSVEVYSPIAWIQAQAAKAKKELRPYGVADVTEQDRADIWRIVAHPSTPTRIENRSSVANVDHVVLRTPNKSTIIQPLTKEPFAESVQNALGAKLEFSGLLTTFPGDAVREIWGPTQNKEFVVTVVGPGWTYDFTIKQKHVKQLLGVN